MLKGHCTLGANKPNPQNHGCIWELPAWTPKLSEVSMCVDVYGVDAVKGPCAVSIFSVLCVLLVIVIVNRVGGGGAGGGGDVNVLCDCKVLLHFHTYVMLRYC